MPIRPKEVMEACRAHPRQAGAGAVATVVFGAHLVLPMNGLASQLTFLAFTIAAAVAAAVAAKRLQGDHSAPWRWVAVGLGFSAAADTYWAVHHLVAPPVPDLSLADPPWIISYVFLITAVFSLLRRRGDGPRTDLEGLIDTGVALTVSLLVFWPTFVTPLLADTTTTLTTRLVWAVYPILDAVLLALVLRVLLTRRASTRVGALLVLGSLAWLLADIGAALTDLGGAAAYAADAGWMLGPALLAMGTWGATRDPALRQTAAPVLTTSSAHRIAPWRMLAAVVPLLVPAFLELAADGTGRPVRLVAGTLVLAALVGARSMLLLYTRDDAERRLRSSERYYMALAANSADAVLLLDASGRVMNEAPHLAALVGLAGTSTRGFPAIRAVCDEDASRVTDLHAAALASPGVVFDGELRLKAADGPSPWLAIRAVNLLDDPDVRGIVVNFHEITDRKLAEQELVRLAFHDSLTGLANRALFHERIQHVLDAGAGPSAAVLFLDLDGFKDVNDGLGHDAGDELLRHVGARLLRSARPGDTVARLGGDEFAILLEHAADPRVAAHAVADRILHELRAPVLLDDGLMTLSASIGIAIPDSDATTSSLLRDADVAMYAAKSGGRARWVEFAPSMRSATLERLQLSQDLASALDGDQLRVVYQPIVDLATGAVTGFEALLRWEHPTLGVVKPDRFIPLAEQTGLIAPIGRWVLRTACQTLRGWQAQHDRPELTIAVNISGHQLASRDLVTDVADALASSGVSPSAVTLEMTESSLIDGEPSVERMRRLRALGVRLAIDDFGTGYSSLSYLRQFAVDILKIDRSFIASMSQPGEMPAMVRGLLDLGRTLGLELIAEGIETEVQLGLLQAADCALGQGYLFSPPLDAEAAADALGGDGFRTIADAARAGRGVTLSSSLD